jgi:hypothetical protein
MKNLCSQFVFGTFIAFSFCGYSYAGSQPKLTGDSPCANDIHKYCSDVTPGGGRLAKCMKKHASELSAGCRSFGKKYVKEHPEVAKEISSEKKKS